LFPLFVVALWSNSRSDASYLLVFPSSLRPRPSSLFLSYFGCIQSESVLVSTLGLDDEQVRSLHLDKPDGWASYALRESSRQIGEGADAIVEKEEG
jgi:hypothetical protein